VNAIKSHENFHKKTHCDIVSLRRSNTAVCFLSSAVGNGGGKGCLKIQTGVVPDLYLDVAVVLFDVCQKAFQIAAIVGDGF